MLSDELAKTLTLDVIDFASCFKAKALTMMTITSTTIVIVGFTSASSSFDDATDSCSNSFVRKSVSCQIPFQGVLTVH